MASSPSPGVKVGQFMKYRANHIGKQQRLRGVCAFAQTPLSLHCSHTHSMDIYEDSNKNLDLQLWPIDQHVSLLEAFAVCDKYQNLACWPQCRMPQGSYKEV